MSTYPLILFLEFKWRGDLLTIDSLEEKAITWNLDGLNCAWKYRTVFPRFFLLVTVLAGQKRYHFFSPQPKKELKTKQSRVGLDLDPAEALSVLLSTAYSLSFFNFYFSAWSWLFVLEYSIRSLLSFKRKAISALFFLFTIVDIRNLFV